MQMGSQVHAIGQPYFRRNSQAFTPSDHHERAQQWLRSALCRTAEKEAHLDQRRGGGLTARRDLLEPTKLTAAPK